MRIVPKQCCQQAFTLIELIVIMATIVILVAFLVPGMMKAKSRQQREVCANHLKQVGVAFRLWSSDSTPDFPMVRSTNEGGSLEYVAGGNVFRHFQCMSNELNTVLVLACPSDNRISAADFTKLENTNISYFVAVDADEWQPLMLLAGDRNLTTNGVPVGAGLVGVRSNCMVGWSGTMHQYKGNVAFVDGSVRQLDQAAVAKAFSSTGTNLNRLAVP